MIIFNCKNVTRWLHGIHTWGNDKSYEHIKKIKEIINPKPEEKKS